MGIANMVWHCLITMHHGSHYDYHVWLNYYLAIQKHYFPPTPAVNRVLNILATKCGL